MTLLSIITLNYKTPNLTLNLLESIFEKYKSELDTKKFEVIVVDNASRDDSVEVIKKSKYISQTKLVLNDTNLGFGQGNNSGAQNATGQYLLFLNSDTTIRDNGLAKMIEYMNSNKKTAILGGSLIDEKGKNRSPAGKFYSIPYVFLMLFFSWIAPNLRFSPKKIKSVDWISGAFMMIRKEAFDKLEGFDKNIFMYVEDMEICYRAKKLGYEVIFFPTATLYHAGQGSSSRSFAIINIYKGILYFYKKHKGKLSYLVVKSMLVLKAVVLVIIGKILNNKYLVSTYSDTLKI